MRLSFPVFERSVRMPSWSSLAHRTRRPVFFTSTGSLFIACCTRFCTFMSATSRSVPTSKVMPSE